jgi:hypothetical protein
VGKAILGKQIKEKTISCKWYCAIKREKNTSYTNNDGMLGVNLFGLSFAPWKKLATTK